MQKNINYPLIEEKRPPLYTCMKYWGKKPHNIWRDFISNYTQKYGVFLDPFAGSAIGAFESFKVGRKAIAFDINPLTSFIIETVSSKFDLKDFTSAALKIIESIECSEQYKKLYVYQHEYPDYFIQNVKWSNGTIYEVCYESFDGRNRMVLLPNKFDEEAWHYSERISITSPHPSRRFDSVSSISDSFVKQIGIDFSSLYTQRNLWVLSEIFGAILKIEEQNLKMQLLYAFIQTIHLSSKMCIPRSKKTNRDFSTSWGRPAYIASKKSVEMNPLSLFRNSCFGKGSVSNALLFANDYFNGRKPNVYNINESRYHTMKNIDILCGVVDAKRIDEYLPKSSVDFILTDPPYGGLIQYLDLSTIWLSWLELYDPYYAPDYNSEITINKVKTKDQFCDDMTIVFKKLNDILRDSGSIIITFNSNNFDIWNTFLNSLENASLHVESVIYQQNKRTGEANVSNRYGTSATDFYIRCSKNKNNLSATDDNSTETNIVNKIKEILAHRGEPTPYQILLNCFYAEDAMWRYTKKLKSFDMYKFLRANSDGNFLEYDNCDNKAGQYWWIVSDPYDSNSPSALTNRIKKYISSILDESGTIYNDELLKKIFEKFNSDLTPDLNTINECLKECAMRKGDLWIKKN